MVKHPEVRFEDTAKAFARYSDGQLYLKYLLFLLLNYPGLMKAGKFLIYWVLRLRLPLKWLIKKTVYKNFCGGETPQECLPIIKGMRRHGVHSILDYSAEGNKHQKGYEKTFQNLMAALQFAEQNRHGIPFSVFKMTGLASRELLTKIQEKQALTDGEEEAWQLTRNRVHALCEKAWQIGLPIFIDAEETWIQEPIDQLAFQMMEEFNKEKAIVYFTVQLYRKDGHQLLKKAHMRAARRGFQLGVKLVRGAYMEKEAERAQQLGYENPLFEDKQQTDDAYQNALVFCLNNKSRIYFCAATHNEFSCLFLKEVMEKHGLAPSDPHVWFAQLYGMSGNISFNLAAGGYNVAKYLPFGPVREVMPYLFRRAEENTSTKGQSSRELRLIIREIQRRRQAAKQNH